MTSETLEENSLWHRYKTEVWLQDTPEAAVVHNAMRILRSIRNFTGLAYASVPITSGKYLYDQMLVRPEKSRKELLSGVFAYNYSEGCGFVKELESRLDIPIVFPAELVPTRQDWEQAHFQALWLSIIGEKCTEVHMSPDWEYSDGGSEEFTHTMQLRLGLPRHRDLLFYNTKGDEGSERKRMRNIKIYDAQGEILTLDDGITKIEASSTWLKRHDFGSRRLDYCLKLLRWTSEKLDQNFYQ